MATFETETNLAEGLNNYDRSAGEAIAYLRGQGYPIDAPAPTYYAEDRSIRIFDGRIPADITVLTDTELGHLLGLLSGWRSFVNAQFAIADIMTRTAEAKLKFAHARIRSSLSQKDPATGKHRSIPDKDQIVITDIRYTELHSKFIYWDGIYRYLRALAESAESAWNTVSRRITQRLGEQGMGWRGNTHSGPAGSVIPNYRGVGGQN